MAILSDFFAASPNQITAEVLQVGPTRVFPTISATLFTTLELAPLLQIVRGGSLDDAAVIAAADEFEDVLGGGPEGPWLNRFPDALHITLAMASEEDVTAYAARWAEAEELAGVDHRALETLLQDLAALARSAHAQGKELYLWVNL